MPGGVWRFCVASEMHRSPRWSRRSIIRLAWITLTRVLPTTPFLPSYSRVWGKVYVHHTKSWRLMPRAREKDASWSLLLALVLRIGELIRVLAKPPLGGQWMLLKDGVERGKKRINIPDSYEQTNSSRLVHAWVGVWRVPRGAITYLKKAKYWTGNILRTCTQQRAFNILEYYSYYHAKFYDDSCTSHRWAEFELSFFHGYRHRRMHFARTSRWRDL